MGDLSGLAAKSDRAAERAPTTHLSVLSSVPSAKGSSQAFWSCPACLPRPFLSSSSVKVTLSPSLSIGSPACSTAVACTNTSLEPSSGVMKPKPLALLKNLTVPVSSHDEPFPLCVKEPVMNGPTLSPDDSGSGKGLGRRWPASNQKVSTRPRVGRTGSSDMGRVGDKYKQKPQARLVRQSPPQVDADIGGRPAQAAGHSASCHAAPLGAWSTAGTGPECLLQTPALKIGTVVLNNRWRTKLR